MRPQITVIGVGGSGGNAVNNMMHSNLEGVDFLIANTDAQALKASSCERKIQLGVKSTRGLGAGMRPDVGRQAAEETLDEINEKLDSEPELVNNDPYGDGWMIKIKIEDGLEIEKLLDFSVYENIAN